MRRPEALLAQWLEERRSDGLQKGASGAADEKTHETLKALGYVE